MVALFSDRHEYCCTKEVHLHEGSILTLINLFETDVFIKYLKFGIKH